MILADYQYDADTRVQRAFYISKYEPDRINGTIKLTVSIFTDAAKQEAMKTALATAKTKEAEVESNIRAAQKIAFDFSQLTTQQKQAQKTSFDSQLNNANAAVETARKELETARMEVGKNGPNLTGEYVIPADSINVNSFTLDDLYNALATQLTNVQPGAV